MSRIFGKGAAKWRAKLGSLFRRSRNDRTTQKNDPAPEPAKQQQRPQEEPEPTVPAIEAELVEPALSPARWLRAGEEVRFGEKPISGPCYFGTSTEDSYAARACINPKLPLGRQSRPIQHGRFEKTAYDELEADERLSHLEWIGQGRQIDHPDNAAVHLYALEYRALQELLKNEGTLGRTKQTKAELIEIVDEVQRFTTTGADERTRRDAIRIEGATRILIGDDPTTDRLNERPSGLGPPPDVVWWIGRQLRNKGRLIARDAYLWWYCSAPVASRSSEEYRRRAGFREIFRTEYPEGWRPVQGNVEEPDRAYHATSGWFQTDLNGALQDHAAVPGDELLQIATAIGERAKEPRESPVEPTAENAAAMGWRLDDERIREVESETVEVTAILNRYFSEDDER